jgi:hypothetical protein
MTRLILRMALAAFMMCGHCHNTAAQPGDEPQRARAAVKQVQDRIKQAEMLVATYKPDAWQYANLGALYVELYKALYRDPYSHYYGEKPPELSAARVLAKSVDYFTQGIKIQEDAGYYAGRAEAYGYRWFEAASAMNWYDDMRLAGDPQWHDMFDVRTEEKEWSEFDKLLKIADYDRAVADAEKSIAMPHFSTTASQMHQLIARLLLERTQLAVRGMENDSVILTRPNRFSYSLFADLDSAIDHIYKSGVATTQRMMEPIPYQWFVLDTVIQRYALYYKADLAAGYGMNEIALKTLNEAAPFVDKGEAGDYFICQFYPFRSRMNSLAGKYDAALADALVKPNGGSWDKCYNADEPLADAYAGKGNIKAAIESYTKALAGNNTNDNERNRMVKKLAQFYLKLGKMKEAIVDVTYLVDHGPDRAGSLWWRASLYRRIGDLANAKKDETAFVYANRDAVTNARNRSVYGKIRMPDDRPLDQENAFVKIVYANGKFERWYPSIDEKARFSLYHILPKPFYLYGAFETFNDGVPVRYFGRSKLMAVKAGTTQGPFIITLDHIEVRKPDR